MKKSTVKRLILAGLILVLVYVWWTAFDQMGAESTGAFVVRQVKGTGDDATVRREAPEYRPARINPFFRGNPEASPPKATQATAPRAPTPEKVSNRYRLVGVLDRSSQSQAVLRRSDQSSVYLSVGDTLDRWIVRSISKSNCVFDYEGERDTAWLYTLPESME